MFATGILILFGCALVAAPLVILAVLLIGIPVEREAARVRAEAREGLEAKEGSQ